jgi:hypothetical protein
MEGDAVGKVAQRWRRSANMTDDQRYQNWLQARRPEQQQTNGDMAKICFESILVVAFLGSIAYFVGM